MINSSLQLILTNCSRTVVRPGSVIPLGPKNLKSPVYDYTQNLELRAYGLQPGDSKEIKLPSGKGAEIQTVLKVSVEEEKAQGGGLSVEVVVGKLGGWDGVLV